MFYSIYASSEETYMYYDYNNPIKQTNNLTQKEKIEPICIICWVDIETLPILLKQNKNYITFCDCNTPIHNDCLKKWYSRTYSCPICRTYLIYDPDFTHRVRIRRQISEYVSYVYKIGKQITNCVFVFAAWNIALNILCNIYLLLYPIDVRK
jgi:hypothetical protein